MKIRALNFYHDVSLARKRTNKKKDQLQLLRYLLAVGGEFYVVGSLRLLYLCVDE